MDLSRQLYERYFASEPTAVIVTLLSGIKCVGFFIGFCRGDASFGEAYILRWHFWINKSKKDVCRGGACEREYEFWIDQSEILSVVLLETAEKIFERCIEL